MKLAPILLFTYKKVTPLKATIEALGKNQLASESDLIIFSDGAKSEKDNVQVNEVRAYLKKGITGFKQVVIFESLENKGLATSIIDGVSKIIEERGSAIVLEDDLVTSKNFLLFMNQALNDFKNDDRVHSISGYTMPIKTPLNYSYDNYFTRRASSWGWATWKDRWVSVDWSVSDYNSFISDGSRKKKFNEMGSDMTSMLSKQMNGEISSWAIRWCYHQFKFNQLSVFPTISKVVNIGFGLEATHTKFSDTRFETHLDSSDKTRFSFDKEPKLRQQFVKQFISKYSLRTRIYYKIKNILGI
ncbi:sugar transferase [Zobellia alginiliquefaciens]|uniref:sugar transferase n=1 Tax=Zobellia alginiliquefaciens TaxID=3032586 RepID=UPI0023E146C0|nr:sugar transferase [Zobellia alginiliquefaciens]